MTSRDSPDVGDKRGRFVIKKFGSVAAFARDAVGTVYFHVYHDTPDAALLSELSSRLVNGESAIGIDAADSAGFLAHLDTPYSPPYIGAFCKGAFIDYANCVAKVPELMEETRRFS
jgi:hypothetical protein